MDARLKTLATALLAAAVAAAKEAAHYLPTLLDVRIGGRLPERGRIA
jgi:hypothetical protein